MPDFSGRACTGDNGAWNGQVHIQLYPVFPKFPLHLYQVSSRSLYTKLSFECRVRIPKANKFKLFLH